MSERSYLLERYTGRSSRYTCPACEKAHEFTRYVNSHTGEPLHRQVGRCNREAQCGYHYTPRQYFEANPEYRSIRAAGAAGMVLKRPLSALPPTASTIPWQTLQQSLNCYQRNAFVRGLSDLFTAEVAFDLARRYLLGTARSGGTIFWQVDERGIVHAGKVMQYDADSLKRIKQTADGRCITPQWAHRLLRCADYCLRQCLFGQHLLAATAEPAVAYRPVAVVESEKSAVIASIYLPEFIWLATGGCGAPQFKDKAVLNALRLHEVWLFPDTGTTEKWETYAQDLRRAGLRIHVNADLEAINLARPPNWDLADEFLSFARPVSLRTGQVKWALTEMEGYPVFWDYPAPAGL